MEMPSLIGDFIIIFHFLISGNWSNRSLTVFKVAVAVIKIMVPPRALSSPDESAMAGRKADFSLVFKPQLTTLKDININEFIAMDAQKAAYTHI